MCRQLYASLIATSLTANALGTYGSTFLRGAYPSSSTGIAEFQTIFPGYTTGSANHINIMVHTSSSTSGSVIHVGQVFFTDRWTDVVSQYMNYAQNKNTRTVNAEDGNYAIANSAGYSAIVEALGSLGLGLSILAIWLQWLVPSISPAPPPLLEQPRQHVPRRLRHPTSTVPKLSITTSPVGEAASEPFLSEKPKPVLSLNDSSPVPTFVDRIHSPIIPPSPILTPRDDNSITESDSSSRRSSLSLNLSKRILPFSNKSRSRREASPVTRTPSLNSETKHDRRSSTGFVPPWCPRRNSLDTPFDTNDDYITTPVKSATFTAFGQSTSSPKVSYFPFKSRRVTAPVSRPRTQPYDAPYFALPPTSATFDTRKPPPMRQEALMNSTKQNIQDGERGRSLVLQSPHPPLAKRRSASEGWNKGRRAVISSLTATMATFAPALIVVDMQYDFVHGSLAVANGIEIIPKINDLLTLPFVAKIASKDFHPPNHISFAATHEKPVFSKITIYPPNSTDSDRGLEQVLWPVHCVAHTPGSEFVEGLNVGALNTTVLKGTDQGIETYSAFCDPWHLANTTLPKLLEDHRVTDVFIVGIAGDYCVKSTAFDAVEFGYKTWVIRDAVRSVHDSGVEWEEMERKGIKIVDSTDVKHLVK
ncbi:hypothetical protein H0H93_002982 [Arthromyces matolae]|nr:hypothetical protein H0H93_002982 [Arthromyces matolae]